MNLVFSLILLLPLNSARSRVFTSSSIGCLHPITSHTICLSASQLCSTGLSFGPSPKLTSPCWKEFTEISVCIPFRAASLYQMPLAIALRSLNCLSGRLQAALLHRLHVSRGPPETGKTALDTGSGLLKTWSILASTPPIITIQGSSHAQCMGSKYK